VSSILLLLIGLMGASPLSAARAAPNQPLRLRDADDKLVDPFHAPQGTKATVFVFTSVSCPISNRYAPDIRRMHDAFAARGVAFWLVYPNPAESAADIRAHLKEYGYPLHALRDPDHELATRTKVIVTPEAAVYDARGSLVYHGRIDDRYVSIGVERPAATRHDLQDVLTALMAGRPVPAATEPAVGCFIADFVK
jgi:hypothetical protein